MKNFAKGESITELSIELWYLICEVDVDESKASAEVLTDSKKVIKIPERMEDLRDLDKQSLLSMVSLMENY